MIEPLSLITALFLGLFGSSHCLVMCGGIAAALGTNAGSRQLAAMLAFNFGRIFSYSLAGILVATAGLWLQSLHANLMLGLRLLAAVLLVLMGLYIGRWGNGLTRIEILGQSLWKRLQPITAGLMGNNRLLARFQLGLLWGWLPCGLIYSTLAWVAANGQPLKGGLAMFFFGLGTLPALFGAQLASTGLMTLMNRNITRKIVGLLLIAYGIWTAIALWLP